MDETEETMASELVTGASRGIGRAIARALAERGDRVAVHYGGDRAAAEETICSMAGSGHIAVGGDISDPESAAAIVRTADEALGGVDILINNAAVAPADGLRHRVDETSFEDWQSAWRKFVDVDLLGAAHMSYLVARRLIERSAPGYVVNVGSRGAYRG